MKKNIFIAVLGLGMAVSAFGQGQILFGNYGGTSSPKVTYSGSGMAIGSGFNAGLLYYIGTSTGETVSLNQMTQYDFGTAPTFGLGVSSDGGSYAGWVANTLITLPGVTSANKDFVYVVLEAYDGSSYLDSTYAGMSSVYNLSVTGSSGDPVPYMSNAFGFGGGTLFTVAPVPEPTTLALAGLGGFGMFMALRRKKA